MRKWIEPEPIHVSEELRAAAGGHALVAEALARRGITAAEEARAFLDPDRYRPASAYELPGMQAAVERLAEAVQRGERICVWGDFDVDGQTATTLLVATLEELGAAVTYHIPIRESEGHGVNLPALKQVIEEGAQLVLTCDTGVSAHEAVGYAKPRAVDVIVTDHHDPPEPLPKAHTIVNPKLLENEPDGRQHPLATLPGAGVAYKLAEALCQWAGKAGLADRHLDLVALGIVADIALQKGDTRYLLQRGLEALRKPQRLGLRVMMELAELDPAELTEEHIGYVVAPRLNALGRLADANLAVELLRTQDAGRARVLATQLEGLNAERQLLTNQVSQAAQAQIERKPALLDCAALVLAHPHWPAGVIGIVASQLVERYNRPVVLVAAPPGEAARGSARSIGGINITRAIATQSALISGFGGHPMAAGLALPAENIEAFREGLSQAVAEMIAEMQLEPQLKIDSYLGLSQLNPELVAELGRLAPFGPGNPPLTFASKNLILKGSSAVGRNGEHRRLILEDEEGFSQTVMWWNGSSWPLPDGRFDLAYSVRAGDHRSQGEVRVEWVEARPAEETVLSLQARPITVMDYRGQPQPAVLLKGIPEEVLQVWCEGEARAKLSGLGMDLRDRYALSTCQALAIWTAPPGRRELQAVLEQVAPERVYVFGVDPGSSNLESFLMRLVGLVKYALNAKAGCVKISELAAATAQKEAVVRKGLEWMAAKGYVQFLEEEGQVVLREAVPTETVPTETGATRSGGEDEGMGRRDENEVTRELKALLEESAAYRAHFARAEAEGLIGRVVE
jgi:single-stranded-DNA-specific exonuclease